MLKSFCKFLRLRICELDFSIHELMKKRKTISKTNYLLIPICISFLHSKHKQNLKKKLSRAVVPVLNFCYSKCTSMFLNINIISIY